MHLPLSTLALLSASSSLLLVSAITVPSLSVPACPKTGRAAFDKTIPDGKPFPPTTVDLCYGASDLVMFFTANDERSFFYNRSQGTNDAIYNYEVMEAFLVRGTNDPQTYLELEVNPGNTLYHAFVYNPSKVRADGAAFEHFYINNTKAVGITSTTKLDKPAHKWTSNVTIPLGLFNVDKDQAKGTEWRMNFFRTVTNATFYPNQTLGGWSRPNKPSFHITPYFGNVKFI